MVSKTSFYDVFIIQLLLCGKIVYRKNHDFQQLHVAKRSADCCCYSESPCVYNIHKFPFLENSSKLDGNWKFHQKDWTFRINCQEKLPKNGIYNRNHHEQLLHSPLLHLDHIEWSFSCIIMLSPRSIVPCNKHEKKYPAWKNESGKRQRQANNDLGKISCSKYFEFEYHIESED